MNRRTFLGTSAASLAGLGLTSSLAPSLAAPATGDLKFLFVFNNGGWDPTRVFADAFDNSSVDMERAAERSNAGEIVYVSHRDRPSVDSFMSAHHQDMLVLNGMQVRSIAHDICTMLALTGGTSGQTPDWATLIAANAPESLTLPHLVLGGPSFSGDLGALVARTGANGQLEGLLSGDVLAWSDTPVEGISSMAEGVIDRYVQRRASARASISDSGRDLALAGAFAESLDKSLGLKNYRYVMDFSGGSTLASQAVVAADALSLGLSRCVSLGYPDASVGLGWDSHAENDDTQSGLWEGLFQNLLQIMEILGSTPGTGLGSLADETVVVVLSEMGRTPQLNGTNGKDHWPYTSAMILGPGFTGDRVVGGWDERYYGNEIDPTTAEIVAKGDLLTVEGLGGALLTLADIDPYEHISGAEPLLGVLS